MGFGGDANREIPHPHPSPHPRAHLALATHSMVTSEVPATTLVFLGGTMMVGAMGSAGPPTSGEKEAKGRAVSTPCPPWGVPREGTQIPPICSAWRRQR